jgi:hypothetical protein
MTDVIEYTHAVQGARSEEHLGKATPPTYIRVIWHVARIKEDKASNVYKRNENLINY